MTIDETYPMRLFYDVSLKAGAADKLENPDAQMKTYINANKNENNQVYFYSNQYDKTQSGENLVAQAHMQDSYRRQQMTFIIFRMMRYYIQNEDLQESGKNRY